MSNEHCNAERTDRSGFNSNPASVISFCAAPNSWELPNAELDMFSRWIKLSDDALAANPKSRKKARPNRRDLEGSCPRSRLDWKFPIRSSQLTSVGATEAVQIS